AKALLGRGWRRLSFADPLRALLVQLNPIIANDPSPHRLWWKNLWWKIRMAVQGGDYYHTGELSHFPRGYYRVQWLFEKSIGWPECYWTNHPDVQHMASVFRNLIVSLGMTNGMTDLQLHDHALKMVLALNPLIGKGPRNSRLKDIVLADGTYPRPYH